VPISESSSLETLQAAAGALGNGTAIDFLGIDTLSCQLSGTFSATVTFEGSIDGGTTYAAVGMQPLAGGAVTTTATAPGIFVIPVENTALSHFRARVSTFVSGTVTVVSRKGYV
jgi:hypothetical protein